ncbi:hypothetical protein [Rhodococcus wratislaviensis]|uniref:Peptidase M50 family protein n=1 Tax=Rhodococcus wratislaviensis NBRC 100605 TaxID=1219028 RepID=X0Q3D3_RHOWR|nr:hypothetical protein [Rhodococcus wratislaviensis]GAF45567.1 hypothetical protein RW1_022_01470 [Rhodococcus wratislaviensis NBRC 100605]
MVQFADTVSWRISKRGLVLSNPDGDPYLLDHAHADRLPELLAAHPTAADLTRQLGDDVQAHLLVNDMLEAGLLCDPASTTTGAGPAPASPLPPKRVVLTRSGLEIAGIAHQARIVHRILFPFLSTIYGRVLVGAIVVAGLVSLLIGRPDAPQVSTRPWVDATLGLGIGLACAAAHEMGHAVALVHYGRTPGRAGCGFYWGALCFYVDSSSGLTLPRRARIIQALAGLAVDAVTVSILAIVAQTSSTTLFIAVCWRMAITGILNMVDNGLPILQVDGQIALADYLDEPDLAIRARAALGETLRRKPKSPITAQPSWLPGYGAFSLVGGISLLVAGAVVWWWVIGDLLRALFTGNPAEIVIGVYLVGPFLLGILFSIVGLVIEVATQND